MRRKPRASPCWPDRHEAWCRGDYSFSDLLLELVQEGKVPASRIDDEAVRRIVTVKYQLGLFDDPLRGIGLKDRDRLTRIAASQPGSRA